MNIPRELFDLVTEKCLLSSQKFFHKMPQKIVKIVSANTNLAKNFTYNSDTVRWLIAQENVQVMDWLYKNRNIWHNLPNDVIILAIVTYKPKMIEWADKNLDQRLKSDILYTFKAVCAKNDWAVEFLRGRGYKWSDDLLHLDNF